VSLLGAPRVVVTGLGAVTPHGAGPQALFGALLEGRSAIARRQVGEPPFSAGLVSAACEGFDPVARFGRARLNTMDRNAQLAVAAGADAWRDAGLDDADDAMRERTPLLWGTGAGGANANERGYRELLAHGKARVSPLSVVLGMHNAAASHLALQLRLGGACLTYSVACASSAVAIGEALRRLRAGECELALAGGSEAALPFGGVKAWQSLQVLAEAEGEADAAQACKPFDARRSGLVLGEGAAALVLETLDHARARGARIHAELAGYGASCDHHHLTTPDSGGQVRALQAALRDARLAPQEVDHVNAHGTATRDGDPVEIAALRQVFGAHAGQVAVSATKALHGHLMGAAGAIEALVTVLSLQEQTLPATATLQQVDPACSGVDHVTGSARQGLAVRAALSSSFAFGGSNAVLAFRAWH
jgi:3-oxoacyl-[acyl-carrier-protein] synthase II